MENFFKMLALGGGSGGSGGGADWNAPEGKPGHVLNRTHYEEVTEVGGDTLNIEYDFEDSNAIVAGSTRYVKVSDLTPERSYFDNGAIFRANYGAETWVDSTLQYMNGTDAFAMYLAGEAVFVVVYAPADGMPFTETGMYIAVPVSSTCTLQLPNYTGFKTTTTVLKKLDPKYLPEALQFGETVVGGDTLTWDGNTDGLVTIPLGDGSGYVKISSAMPTVNDLKAGCSLSISAAGETQQFAITDEMVVDMGIGVSVTDYIIILYEAAVGEDLTGEGGIITEAGIYTVYGSGFTSVEFTINGYTGFETKTIKPMDAKYLPNVADLPAEWLAELKTALGIA